jgi:chromosome segregation ATPase
VARSGNGIDLAAIYQLLTEISGRLDSHETKLNDLVGTSNEHSRRFDEIAIVLNDHGRRFDDLSHELTGLRDAVGQYHHSVVGQGIALNEIEERVKRLEDHLGPGAGGG